ncbi:MAG TPA: right-handed parallel beta-helix repeat-containing protein [Gaiellaceae bacterium]|nr:right-handed parallel beta-helix repeat-containing protein [Gaiellaceae bacterium]HVV83727.1 right-handed parallel beta-helix repeat-containing protein [Kofleriaceae bacterium]
MSYTLSGRIQSRLGAAVPALVVALALQRWWAIELVALMLAIGLALDAGVYHRALAYQPAWAAVPLGALELGLTYGAMRLLWEMPPPLWEALLLYGVAWLSGQVSGHALFPRLRLDYAEAGGELGRAGVVTAAAVALTLVGGLGAAYAVLPPTVHLHGVVQGPLVITRSEKLVGGIVRGGIVVHADHVTISHVSVVGGEYGINVEHADHVMLDHVRVLRSQLDGIRALDAGVMIHDCSVSAPAGPLVTGILISYSMGRSMSMVSGCHVSGTREGIATHSSMVDIMDNHVSDTSVRGILLGEMSMDMASGNDVEGARGIGISCMDHSMCEIKHNTIAGTRVADPEDPSAGGVAIESYFYGEATVDHNTIVASPGGVRAFVNSSIERG